VNRRRLRAVADEALELLEREGLFSADVDWPAARASLDAALDAGCAVPPAPLAVHRALFLVAKQAGGNHTGMRGPKGEYLGERPPEGGSAALSGSASPSRWPSPSGRLIDDVGYLRLPGCPGGFRPGRRYARAGGAVLGRLSTASTSGWIVDLRENGGGSMWPMLAAVAPLLDEGVLGEFVSRDGRRALWSRQHRRILLDRRRLARSRGPADRVPGRDRVAVLLSGQTASSGEAVAVAFHGQPGVRFFGAPTYGFTTANQTHRLRDGSLLHLTTSRFANRSGVVFDGPVLPDEVVEDDCGPGPDDATGAAARAWVRDRSG
jgi:carboxyl-terminal processing protease